VNKSVVLTLVVGTFLSLFIGFAHGEGESKLDAVKRRFEYAKWESNRPKYDVAVTNWQPNFAECGGTNFVKIGAASTNSRMSAKYTGEISGCGRFYVDVYEMSTPEAAHEVMMIAFTRANVHALQEVAETSQRVGDRCFLVRDAERTVGVCFLRNNVYVSVAAVQKEAAVKKVAKALDKQLHERCKKGVPIQRDSAGHFESK
jgi:hypothetical protein